MSATPSAAPTARLGDDPRRPQHRLGRHATGVEAITAEAVALDERDARTETCCAGGAHEAGGAASDHDEVVL